MRTQYSKALNRKDLKPRSTDLYYVVPKFLDQLKIFISLWTSLIMVRVLLRYIGPRSWQSQYSPVQLELTWLVNSLFYGTRAMLVLNLPAFENKKYTAYDRFHGWPAKSRPRNNKSERWDLPQDYLAI